MGFLENAKEAAEADRDATHAKNEFKKNLRDGK